MTGTSGLSAPVSARSGATRHSNARHGEQNADSRCRELMLPCANALPVPWRCGECGHAYTPHLAAATQRQFPNVWGLRGAHDQANRFKAIHSKTDGLISPRNYPVARRPRHDVNQRWSRCSQRLYELNRAIDGFPDLLRRRLNRIRQWVICGQNIEGADRR
jgi:hypothetical protein